MACDDRTFLNDSWVLYFHDPNNDSWNDDSFHVIAYLSTTQDILSVCRLFHDMWSQGMFFVMRSHIKPVWEDPHNMNGGCFSSKVMKPEVSKSWHDMLMRTTGESLLHEQFRHENWDKICGVSISPKRNYSIIRIWISDQKLSDINKYNIHKPSHTSILFKPHACC